VSPKNVVVAGRVDASESVVVVCRDVDEVEG
jgi:hypothetical protein